jgi:hypothetical protein
MTTSNIDDLTTSIFLRQTLLFCSVVPIVILSFVQVYYRVADTMERLIVVHNMHVRVGFPVVNVLEATIILLPIEQNARCASSIF